MHVVIQQRDVLQYRIFRGCVMRVPVTGGSGYFASSTVRELAGAGH